jgi:putative transposase
MRYREVLEAEMTELLGASPNERTETRSGYRAGYYGRGLVTRIGAGASHAARPSRRVLDGIVRAVCAQREGTGGRARRDVRAGCIDPQVKAIAEELCGHSFSASAISAINKGLDATLAKFAHRPLEEAYPYLIVDARYEKVRESGVIRSQAVLIAIGVNWEGHRQVLAVELANRESLSSWKEFLLGLKKRGLSGVEFVASDDHAGFRKAIGEVLPEAAWQRCYVHFLRNALDYLPLRPTMTACRNCAGCTTVATCRKHNGIWLHGLASGRASIRSSWTGWRATLPRR